MQRFVCSSRMKEYAAAERRREVLRVGRSKLFAVAGRPVMSWTVPEKFG